MNHMRGSCLPVAGENLFQRSKKQCAEAEAEGLKLFKVSIGQPSGPALIEARAAAAIAILSDSEKMHEYQDNTCHPVPNFAMRFAQCHVKETLSLWGDSLSYLPIPGIKPMLGVVIAAMGGWVRESKPVKVGTMTKPGYPTPADQCQYARGVEHIALPLREEHRFLFDTQDLEDLGFGEGDLLMLNFPENPTGIIGQAAWLSELCEYCEARGIRIFNDAAYAILCHSDEAVTLTDVAVKFPNLNWAEAFSSSKAGNNTGWRIGGIVGSSEFVGDIARIKGNTDSGFNAALAIGILELYEKHSDKIAVVREIYRSRLKFIQRILQDHGMKLAVEPKAGFFALYKTPKQAFGRDIQSADHFSELLIKKSGPVGIVGIPFHPYIRFSVAYSDVVKGVKILNDAFEKAEVSY